MTDSNSEPSAERAALAALAARLFGHRNSEPASDNSTGDTGTVETPDVYGLRSIFNTPETR